MSEYVPSPTETVWLLFDKSNGHKESHRYVWWFSTKREAIEFKREHNKRKLHATLSNPIAYIRSKLDTEL